MADAGLSCPLCLVANDPADMLGVVIAHAVPVPDALIGLCKRCVVAIVKTAMATELISPAEVFGEFPPGDAIEPTPCELCGMRLGHSETCPTGKPDCAE